MLRDSWHSTFLQPVVASKAQARIFSFEGAGQKLYTACNMRYGALASALLVLQNCCLAGIAAALRYRLQKHTSARGSNVSYVRGEEARLAGVSK